MTTVFSFRLLPIVFLTMVTFACNNKHKTETDPVVHTVIIEGMQFNPSEITIHSGDKVIWINRGIVAHDVSEDPDKNWSSGELKVGDSFEMTPEKSVNYFCSIHPTMKGKIKIE